MLKKMIKIAIAIMLVVLFSMPADAKAANCSCCKCSCTCNCTCDCNCNKNWRVLRRTLDSPWQLRVGGQMVATIMSFNRSSHVTVGPWRFSTVTITVLWIAAIRYGWPITAVHWILARNGTAGPGLARKLYTSCWICCLKYDLKRGW